MKNYKISFVGASYLFCHRVFKDLTKIEELRDATVVIHDLAEEPIRIVTGVCKIMNRIAGTNIKVVGTTSRKEALKDADFVMICINVGGAGADMEVQKVCRKYGVTYPAGDTIGPSAIVRSMRNIEALLSIAKDMERFCPDAWMINFTNPMSQLTLAVNKYSKIKCVGLCHEIGKVEDLAARMYSAEPKNVSVVAAGVNHFTWVLEVWANGQNKTKTFHDDFVKFVDKPRTGNRKSRDWVEQEKLSETWKISRVLFDRFGLLPVGGDRHSSEFFPYYFGKRTGNGKLFGMKEIDFPARAKGRAESKARLESWIAGKEDPWDMDKPSGEEAHHIITSVIRNSCHVNPAVNILNNGCMSNIPDDHCVEVPAVVGQYGIKPLSLGKLPENIAALIGRMGSIYKYTVEAAVTGDKKLVMKALVLDPLLQEYENADKLLNELIESQKKYLPKFK